MKLETFQFQAAVEIFLLSLEGKEVLLLHRSKDKEYLPNYYAGLGGKMDLKSIESPYDAAYREIKEESSYQQKEIKHLQLKGIFTVFDRFGKWFIFDFVGKVKSKNFSGKEKISEGILEWIPVTKLPDLNLIQDLRNGTLEKILFSDKFLWIKSIYNKKDKLIDFKINEV